MGRTLRLLARTPRMPARWSSSGLGHSLLWKFSACRNCATGKKNLRVSIMTTFTMRIPDSMAGRLSSSEMRSWLTQFLRNPHPLPPDPGSGYERISLTLPRGLVQTAAFNLRCSPSQALRRLAQERLGPRESARMNSQPYLGPASLPGAGNASWRPALGRPAAVQGQSREGELGAVVAQLIASVVTLALILLVGYFSSKSKKHV